MAVLGLTFINTLCFLDPTRFSSDEIINVPLTINFFMLFLFTWAPRLNYWIDLAIATAYSGSEVAPPSPPELNASKKWAMAGLLVASMVVHRICRSFPVKLPPIVRQQYHNRTHMRLRSTAQKQT